MHTFLGVPILLRGIAYGNFYLTEKEGGADFTEEDQEIVSLLAAQAAVAIENARLYEAATQWSRQLESLNEIGNALATETNLDRLLDLVARRSRELLNARLVTVLLPAGGEELRFVAVAGEGAAESDRADDAAGSVEERARDRARPQRARRFGARRPRGRPRGHAPFRRAHRSLGAARRARAHDRLARSARQASWRIRASPTTTFGLRRRLRRARPSPSISRSGSRATRFGASSRLRSSSAVGSRASCTTRPGQALTSILLGLKSLEDAVGSEEARGSVAGLRELVVATLQDVRRLAVELRPKVLDDFGLVPALERLTESFAEQTEIDVRFETALGDERLPAEVETALYRIVQEALTNVVKHAHARSVSIVLARKPDTVALVIEDDGRGFDPATTREGGFGLEGMRERVGSARRQAPGRDRVRTRGTTIVAEVRLP